MSTNTNRHDAGDDVPESRLRSAQGESSAAARLLELTARETDRWRSDAQDEATAIVAKARAESAELVRAGRDEAERLVATAREEAGRMREEATAQRARHDDEIARLQEVETTHRERLQQHLTEMLDRVRTPPRPRT